MLKIKSTNITLLIADDVGKNIVVVDKKNVEELRNLLNDYLEHQKKYGTS